MSTPQIFLSYRRQDTIGITGRIYDKLAQRFGDDNVFMDFDSIPLGVDFRDHLRASLDRCDVLLVIIGSNWLVEDPEKGTSRLHNPADFVRLEIKIALERGIPVVPVLLGRTPMPDIGALPSDLHQLVYRQALTVDPGRDFHVHTDRLVEALEKLKRAPYTNEKLKKAFEEAGGNDAEESQDRGRNDSGDKSPPVSTGKSDASSVKQHNDELTNAIARIIPRSSYYPPKPQNAEPILRIDEKRKLLINEVDQDNLLDIIPFLRKTKNWDFLYAVLTDYRYLEARTIKGPVSGLVDDLKRVYDDYPVERPERIVLSVLSHAIASEATFLNRHPDCLFQICWNRAWWYDAPEASRFFEVDNQNIDFKPPWEKAGPKVHKLLERWREERKLRYGRHPWVRCIMPPEGIFGADLPIMRRGHREEVDELYWSASGKHLASSSCMDGIVVVWAPGGGEAPRILRGHADGVPDTVSHMDWSPGGDYLAVGFEFEPKIFDISGTSEPIQLQTDGYCQWIRWSPMGDRIAAAAAHEEVFVFDPSQGGDPVLVLRGDNDIGDIAWSPSGDRIAAESMNGEVYIWNASGVGEGVVLRGHEDSVLEVHWSPSEDQLASLAEDGTVRIWDALNRVQPLVVWNQGGHLSVFWSTKGDHLIVALVEEGELHKFDSYSGELTETVKNPYVTEWCSPYELPALVNGLIHQSKSTRYRLLPLEEDVQIDNEDGDALAWFPTTHISPAWLTQHPSGQPIWAAPSGSVVVVFKLEHE